MGSRGGLGGDVSRRLIPFAIAAAVSTWCSRRPSRDALLRRRHRGGPRGAGGFTGTAWATLVTNLALAPAKYVVMTLAVVFALLAGRMERRALTAVAIAIEQTSGEAAKQIAQRPRPSRELVAVVGNPSGFSFPSTFTTFIAVTFGSVLLLSLHSRVRKAGVVAAVAAPVIVVGWAARVALGAHWPSDVVLTTLVCLAWIWAARRVVLPAS